MTVNRMALLKYAAALILSLLLCCPALAAETTSPAVSLIHIHNFGKISDNYYRGGEPGARGVADLAKMGVKTIIDLTAEGRPEEEAMVEHAGMTFHRIPLKTSTLPPAAAVILFLKLVSDPAGQPVYVHCEEGRHRTGVMTAIYRMTHDSWSADQAYAEMKQYRFES